MAYNSPKTLQAIESPVIDLLTTGAKFAFNIPQNFLYIGTVYYCVDLQGPSGTAGTTSLGYNSPNYDNVNGNSGVANFTQISDSITSAIGATTNNVIPANSDIYVNVSVAITGRTVETMKVFLLGFYV
jgi:hypothetical protein